MVKKTFLLTIFILGFSLYTSYGIEKDSMTAIYGFENVSGDNRYERFEPRAVYAKRNGFEIEDGKTYYYKSGVKVIGWQKINRNGVNCWHYFDKSGVMQSGFQWIDNKEYFFKEDGTMAHDSIEEYSGALFCFDSDGQKKKGWHFVNGSWYYFALDNGQAWYGPMFATETDGYNFFFWYDIYTDKNGKTGKKGTLAWGDPYIDIYCNGELVHIADKEGHLLSNTFIEIDGVGYVCDSQGNVQTLFKSKIEEIENNFPVNTYWQHNGSNSPWTYITVPSGKDNQFDYSWQCNGFAKYLFYYVYGEKSTSMYDPYSNISTSKVRVGDYLRIGNNEHSIFVTDIYTGADGKVHWEVAREVWGTQNSIIKSCDYIVVDDKRIKYGNRTYVIDAIRRADNSLRRSVGLEDAEKLQ